MDTRSIPSGLLSCAQLRRLGRHVPELLDRIETDLGPQAMWTLARSYGGRTASVPSGSDAARTEFGRRCGPDIVAWFNREIGHGDMAIPLGPASHSNMRLAICLNALAKGISNAEVATKAGMSQRMVVRLKADLRRRGIDPKTFFQETDPD